MTQSSTLFIGIDVGTGGVRALAVSETGQVVARSAVPFDASVLVPQEGRHEQPPEAWWEAVCGATAMLREELDSAVVRPAAISAVSVDGTSGTLVALDAAGRPLRPAMMYNDPRPAAEAERINAAGAELCQKLGYRFKSSFALAKIAWLESHEPAVFDSTARFVHQADYVVGRLTGAAEVSDYSNALKTGYDLVDECWPSWIDDLLGVADRLPRVVAPGTKVGTVSAEAAAATGLPEGLAVVTGATDGTAACLASGVRRPGDYNTTLGTTLVFKGISRQICRHPQGLIYCHKLPGGLWLPGAASNTGCEWIGAIFPDQPVERLDAAAERLLPSSGLAYPLVRQGERFPFLSERATGFFVPEPDDSVRRYAACLEGVAFVERLAYDVLDGVAGTSGGEVYSTGGGSRSDVWMQCRADAARRVLHRPACPESAFGTAVLAAAGSHYPGLSEAIENMVRVERTFAPNPVHAEHYEVSYERFCGELKKRGYA
jgi:sugar (pentulose or hexulose) kinase